MTRQQTPSEIKWLVNELAAARGELVRIDADVVHVEAQLKRLKALQERQQALCASLEQVLSLSSVVPLRTGAFIVSPHKKYGGRGSLKQWLADALRAQYPKAPTGMELFERAVPHFGLEFTSPAARRAYYNNTFRRQLLVFAQQGLVERVEVREGAVRSRWRWISGVSLVELRNTFSEDQR